MKFSTALTLVLGLSFAPSSVVGSELVERRAKHSSSTGTSGSLKGSAKNRAGEKSSVSAKCLITIFDFSVTPHLRDVISLLHTLQSGKGPSKPDEAVKVVYVPYPYIPTNAGAGDIEYVSEDEDELVASFHTPAPSKRPSEAIKIVYVPVFTEGRSESSDDKDTIIASVKTPVPTKMPTKMPTMMPTKIPSAKPSATPSTKPSNSPTFEPSGMPSASPTTNAPSAVPTNERWCNMEYERGCRDSCFKERGCGANEACKKKCRKQCCSWN